MGKKESFVFYTSVWPQLFKILENDEERGQLIMAIIDYVSLGTLPSGNHSRSFIGAFEIMKEQLDKDADKYQKVIEKKREAGKLGWQATAKQMASKCQADAEHVSADNVNVNDNDNVNDVISNDITISASAQSEKKKRFVKPTVEEVMAYCQERGNTVDAETFVNFYESKGWMVGKNHMKDWKSAVRTWEQSRKGEPKPQETFSSFETDDFIQASLAHSRAKIQESLGG